MIIAQKVEKAVDQEPFQFTPQAVPLFLGLALRSLHADGDISQLPGGNSALGGAESGAQGEQIRLALQRERKHIGGFIFFTPELVQAADAFITRKEKRKLSSCQSRCPRCLAPNKASQVA